MSYDLVEKTLIAASIAAAEGHAHTSKAMIEFAKDLEPYLGEQLPRSLLPGLFAQETDSDQLSDSHT